MTRLLEQAMAEVGHLPEADQDEFARFILAELKSDERWNERFRSSQGRLASMAREALAEYGEGKTLPLDPDKL